MKILKNILTFLLVVVLVGFFVVISYTFGTQDNSYDVQLGNTIHAYKASITKSELGVNHIETKEYQSKDPLFLEKGEVGYFEFGKLASVFVLKNEETPIDIQSFSLSGKEISFDPMHLMVFSLYDPFTTYTLISRQNDFRITEITNGSFYIGTESDGTRSLYSVDAVIRIDFLSQGKDMTDMVLFPGMYIRFDPNMNTGLEGANLFRILQALEPDGTKDITTNTTGIEFVNPRMNGVEDKDSFFMYRLPIRASILFQMLHVFFYDQVSRIALYEEYGSYIYNSQTSTDSENWLINPGKQSHFLLLQLDSVLSNALQNTVSLDELGSQIAQVKQGVNVLAAGNAVETRLENFLTDGRFALFGGSKVNPQFPEIYQTISEVVGKAPVTAHAKLLQKLSDIYSKNLVAQKKYLSFSEIDTYTPTALELEKTLDSSDIQQRDYFDIALYAFNILKTTEEKNMIFESKYTLSHPTYSLIQTILISTDRYVRSIEDIERKDITYRGIILHFYEHIFNVLVRSVYDVFMETKDGRLYLKSMYQPTNTDTKMHIDESLVRDMQNIDGRISLVGEKLDAIYGSKSQDLTYLSVKKSIALFHGFVRILDAVSYSEYLKSPYIQDKKVQDSVMPSYSGGIIVSSDPSPGTNTPKDTLSDPSIDTILGLLGQIPRSNISVQNAGYRVQDAVFQFRHPYSGANARISVSVGFNKNITVFNDITINYRDRMITVITNKTDTTSLVKILGNIPQYIARLDKILETNTNLIGNDIRFLEDTQVLVVDVYPFPLVP